MLPSLPPEILGHIVDSLFTEETGNKYEAKSTTVPKLLFTSRVLRVCALRNLCRTVSVSYDDHEPIDKLREILIPGTVNPRLGRIAPFIQILHIDLENCTSSSVGLDERSALLSFILEQCPLHTLLLEGSSNDVDWEELPTVIRGPIEAILRTPMLRSLEIYSMSGFCTEIFGETPHLESLLVDFSQVPLAPGLKKLRHIDAYDLGEPEYVDGLWNICRYAHQYLEELAIDDDFWDIDSFCLRNKPYLIPDSQNLHAFPKLRKFTYEHLYLGLREYSPCPPVSFFQVEGIVPEFQSLHLCVRMDKFHPKAARSVEEALARLADPNWIVLDSLLTSTNFPNLQHFHLVLEQDVDMSVIHTFVPDADGISPPLAKKYALQYYIEDGLKSSFPHLTASTMVDFKLEAIVNLNKI